MKQMITLRPIIERLGSDIPLQDKRDIAHIEAATNICKYLENRDSQYLEGYYKSVEYLLSTSEYDRIILYLPFEELSIAPDSFQKAYMNSWWNLTKVQDVAENFHEGDIFEVDARPYDDMPRVIKCAHLAPWLLKSGYLSEEDFFSIFQDRENDLLIQSLRDTFPYISNHNLLSDRSLESLKTLSNNIPYRIKYEPSYVSEKRKKWLSEKDIDVELATPEAKLEGPFFPNLKSIDLDEILSNNSDDIILVGGSRFKGYGTSTSDLDVWPLSALIHDHEFYIGSPHAAHIYFNTAWVAKSTNVSNIVNEIILKYDDPETRRQSLERIEADLILYRLLHKGFARFNHIKDFETSIYTDMDGDCPFYYSEYRRIATMLFAKYVFIPHVR